MKGSTREDSTGSPVLPSMRAACVVVAVLLVVGSPSAGAAQSCPGDCSGDRLVAIGELIRCVNIALGSASAGECPACDPNNSGTVTVDELIASVNAALLGCSLIITAEGSCLRPGPAGLEPCAAGSVVRVSRCDDPTACLTDSGASTVLDFGTVGAGGSFMLRVDSRAAGGEALVVEAEVDGGGTTYRVLDFGSVGARARSDTAGSAGSLTTLVIDPSSEAATRLVADNGLENFSAAGVAEITDAVRASNADTTFAGLDPATAANTATGIAANDPAVQAVIAERRMTPIPTATVPPPMTATATVTVTITATQTATASPTPISVNVTAEGTVQPSSVFSSDFPPELAVDGDRRTSWFSDGSAGGPTETFRWTGARDDQIAAVSVLSNAEHANPEVRGFGFGSVRIQVLSNGGTPVFDVTRSLPGATDPDVEVFPDVPGRSVLLTFTDHDDPSCGGFSELRVLARR